MALTRSVDYLLALIPTDGFFKCMILWVSGAAPVNSHLGPLYLTEGRRLCAGTSQTHATTVKMDKWQQG